MLKMTARTILLCCGLCLLALMLASQAQRSTAQLDPTLQRQTLDAIINPRLTATARAINARTATAASIQLRTRAFFATLTQAALTATATPSYTPTITPTLLPSDTPTITPTPSPTPTLNATQIFETIVFEVGRSLTQTAVVQAGQTATVAYQQTFNAILFATLGITPTPTVMSTLDPLDLQRTAEAQVNLVLGLTATAAQAQTGTAAFQNTLNAAANRAMTATADSIRATLLTNRLPITAENIERLMELTQIVAHDTRINSLAFNSIGNQFASAGADNRVRLWDTLSGSNLFTWVGLTDRTSVVISPDGNYLAAGSSDGTVRILDLPTQTERLIMSGHAGAVRAVAFSPDSRFVASASADRSVRLWDARSGAFVRLLGGTRDYTAAATALAFSKDGLLLAVGSEDAQIHLWEVNSGVLINRIRDLHPIRQIALSPDGKLLASVGNSNSVVVWQLSAQPRRILLRGSLSFLTSLAFDPSGKLLAAGSQSGALLVWQLEGGRLLHNKFAHRGQSLSTLAFSPEGAHIVTASAAGVIKIWVVRPSP
jgi:WD40 repeat protein